METGQKGGTPAQQVPISRLQTRRGFLRTCAAAVGVAWAGTCAHKVLFPTEQATTASPVEIPLSELPVGGTQQIKYGAIPVFVRRTQEGVTALSLICTHLGCTVQWQPDKQQFHCPCHDGQFDWDGEVISGPPQLPLEQLTTRILADKVRIGEEF
jgi:Rieske Fe-S protein